jgi:uncharacterized membrane protein
MGKGRIEAFSDGVIAVIITIMVLELKAPHEPTPEALLELSPVFVSYVLSFINIGIYWNNHHHLFHAVKHINGKILWANLHLLFWLSLIPFMTGWMGENHFATWPVVLFGVNLLLAGAAYTVLTIQILELHGKDSDIAKAIGSDFKGKLSIAIYAAGIALAFFNPWISVALYFAVAMMWFIPDRRIEKVIQS